MGPLAAVDRTVQALEPACRKVLAEPVHRKVPEEPEHRTVREPELAELKLVAAVQKVPVALVGQDILQYRRPVWLFLARQDFWRTSHPWPNHLN